VVAAWESASYAPVVPSQSATGEISVAAAAVAVAVPPEETKSLGTNGKKRTGASTGPVAAVAVAEKPKATTGKQRAITDRHRTAPPPIPTAVPEEKSAKKRGRSSGANPVVRDPHFASHEQAFFDEEHRIAEDHSGETKHESFADLDEGKPKVGFWKRLFSPPDGHTPRKKRQGSKTSKSMKAVKPKK
jgi:hypothetical protein